MQPSFKKFSFKKFQNKKKIILIDTKSVQLEKNTLYDAILSPRYYWVKKEKLPVKYTYQAKSYAPSSFDGIVPAGEYKYLAKKGEDGFWIYAYDEKFIIEELEKIGIEPSQLRRVYFAQSEFKQMQNPIKINDSEILIKHDENIIKIPSKMVQESIGFDDFIQIHTLSNFFISLNKFGHIIDFKKMAVAAIALIGLILFYSIHFYWLENEENKLIAQQENIRVKYKMPATKVQTDALIRQLDKKAQQQLLLREKFHAITKIPLEQKEYFSNISFEKQKFTINIIINDKNRITKIQSYLKKIFTINKVVPQEKNVIFEVSYD